MTQKPLFIPLATKWYEKFEDGSKQWEMRPYGPRWNFETCRPGRAALLSKGYGKQHRMAARVVEFRRVDWHDVDGEDLDALRQCYGDKIRGKAIALIKLEIAA